ARGIGVRLWDGTLWPDAHPRSVTIVLKHASALSAMFRAGTELALAEAYVYDDFDIVGDIESIFGLSDALAAATSGWRKKLGAAGLLMRLPHAAARSHGRRGPARLTGKHHSIERDRQAVTYHYDVSNEFYELWLGRNMVYSCGYFRSPDEELDVSQERKLDYICRKLRLRKGQRFLDVGCGWGGLVMHAARHYGVDATGVTLSQPQADLANDRIEQAGLAKRARVQVLDYREVAPQEGADYDAIASVGMFEHVGASKLPTYFAQVLRILRPGGVFLNHGIANRVDAQPVHGRGFVDSYVFPDGELTPISATLHAAEEAGFEVRDLESLREHYTLTLRHWVRRLEAHHEQSLEYVDEPTYRVWRLYMAGSAHGFSTGRLNVYQALLVKPGAQGQSGLPLTRGDWYASRDGLADENTSTFGTSAAAGLDAVSDEDAR
ncbi:MAG: methyltransferase domain-containing protein, partial [Nitrospiraceae bacterium]|nr:methyltransferase domain-containing protein [Nitrospiraceae bacterium]